MSDLGQAIQLYVGFGISSYPKEDGDRVVNAFGPARGETLLREVRQVLNELDARQPDWNRYNLTEGSRQAAETVRVLHPGMDDNTVSALAWTGSYWWK